MGGSVFSEFFLKFFGVFQAVAAIVVAFPPLFFGKSLNHQSPIRRIKQIVSCSMSCRSKSSSAARVGSLAGFCSASPEMKPSQSAQYCVQINEHDTLLCWAQGLTADSLGTLQPAAVPSVADALTMKRTGVGDGRVYCVRAYSSRKFLADFRVLKTVPLGLKATNKD
jgi:hypothetical protein